MSDPSNPTSNDAPGSIQPRHATLISNHEHHLQHNLALIIHALLAPLVRLLGLGHLHVMRGHRFQADFAGSDQREGLGVVFSVGKGSAEIDSKRT